jgi:hypothetical protein
MVNPVTGNVCHGGNRQFKPADMLVIVDQIANAPNRAGVIFTGLKIAATCRIVCCISIEFSGAP